MIIVAFQTKVSLTRQTKPQSYWKSSDISKWQLNVLGTVKLRVWRNLVWLGRIMARTGNRQHSKRQIIIFFFLNWLLQFALKLHCVQGSHVGAEMLVKKKKYSFTLVGICFLFSLIYVWFGNPAERTLYAALSVCCWTHAFFKTNAAVESCENTFTKRKGTPLSRWGGNSASRIWGTGTRSAL